MYYSKLGDPVYKSAFTSQYVEANFILPCLTILILIFKVSFPKHNLTFFEMGIK
jgi:hypothetical protein